MKVTLEKAIELLKGGQVVAMPTETVYGLAASIYDETAIRLIFSTKERPYFDPLIVHVSRHDQIPELTVEWSEIHESLAGAFWPGPMTMILKKTSLVSELISSGLDTVGVRMPSHPQALALIEACGPLAAPSANKFGKTSPTQAEHVEKEFSGEVAVVDGGPCEVGIESTVLQISESNDNKVKIRIFRPGKVDREALTLWAKTNQYELDLRFLDSNISPGHTPEHYQPTKPLYLINSDQKDEDIFKILNFRGLIKRYALSTDPIFTARELYFQMRQMSAGIEEILLCEVPKNFDSEAWRAIKDRLIRASRLDLRSSI